VAADFNRARLLLIRPGVDTRARRTRRSALYVSVIILLTTAGRRSQAEELALGAGLGVSVAADGKNQGHGLGLLLLGEQVVFRRSLLLAQVYGGGLWTGTSSDSCQPVTADRCELAARLAFTGVKGRLQALSRFVDLGVGVGAGTIVTRGGTSRAAEVRGVQLHALFGFGLVLLHRFALSATYLYFPTANHLTGGVSLSWRFRPPHPRRMFARRGEILVERWSRCPVR
jgi:hypothetical protein